MLESMIENPRPTRAEASDVANAIFDGTDAVMLSAETASGKYPREAVCMMAKIVVEAENNITDFMPPRRRRKRRTLSISETICESIAHAAEDLHMEAIAVFTETGNTARLLSKHRPRSRIYAFSHMPAVCNRMNLFWGVQPVRREHALSSEDMLSTAEQELLRAERIDQFYAAACGKRSKLTISPRSGLECSILISFHFCLFHARLPPVR